MSCRAAASAAAVSNAARAAAAARTARCCSPGPASAVAASAVPCPALYAACLTHPAATAAHHLASGAQALSASSACRAWCRAASSRSRAAAGSDASRRCTAGTSPWAGPRESCSGLPQRPTEAALPGRAGAGALRALRGCAAERGRLPVSTEAAVRSMRSHSPAGSGSIEPSTATVSPGSRVSCAPATRNGMSLCGWGGVSVCPRACVRSRVHTCICVRVSARAHAYTSALGCVHPCKCFPVHVRAPQALLVLKSPPTCARCG